MKEYIERAAVEKFIEDGLNNPDKNKAFGHDAIEIMAEVHYMQAADVVEVRHGRWGEYESFPLTPSLNGHPCSECGMRFSTSAIPVMKYCPNCGALMREIENGEK